MAKKRTAKRNCDTRIHLTERALRDIEGTHVYSVKEFGKRVAAQYIANLEATLTRISDNVDLLRSETEFDADFQFYLAGKHLLVCDRQADGIFVLAVLHASMDIPTRLAELQPTLVAEVKLLHHKLMQAKTKRT